MKIRSSSVIFVAALVVVLLAVVAWEKHASNQAPQFPQPASSEAVSAIDSSGNAAQPRVEADSRPPDAGAPEPTAKADGKTAANSAVAASVSDRFARNAVLAEREEAGELAGRPVTKRLRLVRDDSFKYPLLRVEDEFSVESGSRVLVRQTAMVADHVMISVNDAKTNGAALEARIKAVGASVRRKMPASGVWLVAYPVADLDTVMRARKELGGFEGLVKYVDLDYVVHAVAIPNDTSFGNLWGMNNTGQSGGTPDADIDAPEAWDIFTGSAAVRVGVIDTGIDHTHPDLAANIWANPNEIAGNGIDDDGNGYIDDTRGWDFVNNDNNGMDDNGHGTHCAGTIGGSGNNGQGVAGVCWNVSLIPLKFLSASGSGSISDAVEAVAYGTSIGLHLTSNSWGGGGFSQALADAIAAADTAGILFVAAAGNSNSNNDVVANYPSNYVSPNIIAVAATTRTDARSSFSSYGLTTVDLGAPGSEIFSARPGGLYQNLSGTSMATPHVAGACALLKAFRPSLTHVEIKAAILSSVDVIPAMAGVTVSGGRLNIYNALRSLDDLSVSPDSPVAATGPVGGAFSPSSQVYTLTSVGTASALTWTASPSQPWLSASPAGGVLAAGSSTTVTMAFNSAASALATGTYSATVNFTNVSSSTVLKRGVTLTTGVGSPAPLTISVPASSTEGAGLLAGAGTVSLGTAQPTNVVVSLTSTNPAKASVPATATIFAGNLSAPFDVTVGNDGVIDGPQPVIVTGSASGFPNAAGVITVNDNDGAGILSLTAPASVSEGAGTVLGTLTSSVAPGGPLTVTLTSSDTTEIQVPATVVIPAGQTSITFPITVANDTQIDGTQTATITANIAGWTDGVATISVLDSETTNLAITLPATIAEGAAGTGSVAISGTLPAPLVVSLSSNTTSRLTVPATATIATGSTSASFPLSTVNNTLTDGSATVTVTGTASGFTAASATTTVRDNDVHHFNISTIASPKIRGVPFSVTVTAKDVNDITITTYTAPVTLSAAGAGGAVSVAPATGGTFTAGVWTGNVTMNTFDTNVVLTATAAGRTGASNPFTVGTGPVDRFTWSTVPSPQTAGVPFPTSIFAQDQGNNPVTDFGGSVSLRAVPPSISVGTGSATTATLPLYTFYEDQRSQCIYLQSELGGPRTFTGLRLNVTTIPGQTMNNWTIRIKHTALASYSTAAWEATGWTTVYQANETISTTGLATFTFTTPFVYDGASNLMVDFSFNNASWTSAGAVTCTTRSPVRAIHHFTDSGFGDPLTWSGTSSPTPFTTALLPNIQLLSPGGGPIFPTATGNFTNGTWSGNVVALQGDTQMRLQADDAASHTGESNVFDVTGFAGAEISVEQPLLNVLTDGAATVDFGPAAIGGEANSKRIFIRNSGSLPLTITGITGDGPDIASFTFPAMTGVTVPPAGSVSFSVQFAAASAGAKNAAIHIGSNDADENPFDIALTGSGAVSPEIQIEQPSGTVRADGPGTIAFGDSILGVPVVRMLTIRNTGGAVLNLGAITVDGPNGAEFVAGAPSSSMVAPAGTATLNVTFTPGSTGARSAVLHVASNDPNESQYDVMLIGIGSAPAGLLRLARDINQTGAGPGISVANTAVIGSTIYFAANTAAFGTELWKSDGTAAGTMLVRDIFVGVSSSVPTNFRVIDSTLYFSANGGTTGTELWKSDGTTAGTVLVKDIFSGTPSSFPANLTNVAGTLFFTASDSTANGTELWKSDGTNAGTVLVLNINANANAGSSPTNLTAVGSTLFLSANDGVNGVELWMSDGTAAGTVLVSDINAGSVNSSPANLVAVGSTLFFTATDGVNGVELWTSDGASTGLVLDIYAGATSSNPAVLVNAGGTLFFRATTAANGSELWKSDGTAVGTGMVRDIFVGTGSSTPSNLIVMGGGIYFSAFTAANGTELWKSDGTLAGTVLVADINPGTPWSFPANFTLIGDTLYFSAATASGGAELWKTNGLAANTVLVQDLNPGTGSSSPGVMFNVGGFLAFVANDGANGAELWWSDGTGAGTNLIKDIVPGNGNAVPINLRVLGSALLFNAIDGVNGAELWRSDGLPGGTTLLKDIFVGASGSGPGAGVVIGSTLYFPASDFAGGTELWKTDGTNAGTVRVKDINPGTLTSTPANLAKVGSTLFFGATGLAADGQELWQSDGTDSGTVRVANINPTANASSTPANLTDFNGTLVFTANNGTNGIELWKSTGTAGATTIIADISTGTASSSPANLRVIGSTLFFTANTPANGTELWKSDGTTASIVADLATGTASSSPANLTVIGSTLYFSAFTSATSTELWKTDGTAAGTVLVSDIVPGNGGSFPSNLTAVGSTLFFSATGSGIGNELWKSDGTAAGTVLVKDIVVGALSSSPTVFANVNGMLFFSASTTAEGRELWRSDGTAAGTVLAADIRPGALSSNPASLTPIGNQLFFTATGPDLGTELWTYDLIPDIALEQPVGTGLVDGAGSRDFGSIALGENAALTFTVRNTGIGTLFGLSLSKDGANSGDFTLGSLGITTLTPGTGTTFTVTFAPGAVGARSAAIHIVSNDPDENPFNVSLTGTGLATRLEGWRFRNFGSAANSGDGADENDSEFDGMKNFIEFCLATDPIKPTQPGQSLIRNGGDLEFTYTRSKAAVLDGVIFAAKWNDDLTPPVWSSAGVTEMILSDDGVTQQVKATVPAGSGLERFLRLEVTGN